MLEGQMFRNTTTLPKIKHTRRATAQSKGGCFTCRARRVKCDEARPRCSRCLRAGRQDCEYSQSPGSNHPTPDSDDLGAETLSINGIVTGQRATVHHISLRQQNDTTSLRHEHCARSAVDVLCSEPVALLIPGYPAFEQQISQFIFYDPLVSATAYALGAAYKLRLSPSNHEALADFATSCYANALQCLQVAIDDKNRSQQPTMLACVMLVLVEALSDRTRLAVLHLRGARQLLQSQPGKNYDIRQTLGHILQAIELSIAVHALSYSPYSEGLSKIQDAYVDTDLGLDWVQMVHVQTQALAWAATLSQFRYRPKLTSSTMFIEQGRHIANLSKWLTRSESVRDSNSCSSFSYSQGACEQSNILRMTCMATMIYVSTIFDPHEKAYDAYGWYLQQIILLAEQVLSARDCDDQSCPASNRLVVGPGMNFALSLVAQKYRDSSWRRRAMSCLRKNEIELFFSGKRDAAIAELLLHYEEPLSAGCKSTGEALPARLNGYAISQASIDIHDHTAEVILFRCDNVHEMLECECAAAASVGLTRSRCHWQVWEETVMF